MAYAGYFLFAALVGAVGNVIDGHSFGPAFLLAILALSFGFLFGALANA